MSWVPTWESRANLLDWKVSLAGSWREISRICYLGLCIGEGGCTEEGTLIHLHLSPFPLLDSSEIYCILALDVKMWKLLKRLFWHVRCYLLSRLLPTKYFKSQEVLSHSPRDSDITILKFRVCLPQCSVSVDILTIQGMSRGRSDFKEFYKYCVCFDLPIP